MKGRMIHAVILATMAAATLLPSTAMAAAKAHKDMIMKCPVCTMPMPSRKAPGATVRVRVGKHHYYCCSKCGYKGDTKAMKRHGHAMPHM